MKVEKEPKMDTLSNVFLKFSYFITKTSFALSDERIIHFLK